MSNSFVQAQKYQVMAVVGGTATLANGTQTIKTGTELDKQARLRFSNDQVRILVYNQELERKIIRPQNPSQVNNQRVYRLSDNLFDASKGSSSRSGESIQQLADLKKHFCESDRYIFLGGEIKVKINFLKNPQDPDGGFYVRYQHNGSQKNIPLPYEGEYVIVSQKNIYRSFIPFDQTLNIELCHYQSKKQESRCFCQFSLVPVDSDLLKNELQTLLNHLPCHQKVEEVANYVVDRFEGQPVRHNVKKWVELNLCE